MSFRVSRNLATSGVLCTMLLAHSLITPGRAETNNLSLRAEFDRLYAELNDFRTNDYVMISSDPSDHNACTAFTQIVQRGTAFLPFIVEALEAGDFFLNQAMEEITGINIREHFGDYKLDGEQEASELWIRWWQEQEKQPH